MEELSIFKDSELKTHTDRAIEYLLNTFKYSPDINNFTINRQLSIIKSLLGNGRVRQLKECGLNLELVHSFFIGKVKPKQRDGILRNLIGIEANVNMTEILANMGASNIRTEVLYKDTKIDIVAQINNSIKMNTITLGNNGECIKKEKQLCYGEAAFEVKAVSQLHKCSEKLLTQISQIKRKYNKCYVVINKDTEVRESIIQVINNLGCEIILQDTCRYEYINNIFNIKKKFLTIINN